MLISWLKGGSSLVWLALWRIGGGAGLRPEWRNPRATGRQIGNRVAPFLFQKEVFG